MKLNRTGSNWTELERNKTNENWRIIEGNYNDVVDKVSEEAFDKVVNSAKLNWKDPVDKYADLPSGASEGDTRMVRDSGKVYRFNGEVWQEIQQIDAGPVNELDARLTSQLAETEYKSFYRSMINHKHQIPSFTWIDDDGLQLAFDRLLPIARDLGVPLTFAIITSRFNVEGFVDKETVKDVYEEGFDIVDHSYAHDTNHRPTEMTQSELRKDLAKTKEIWESLGIPNNNHVIPFGANTPTTQRIYREFFDSAIMTSVTRDNIEEGRGAPNFLPLDNYRLERISYNHSSLNYIKDQIDDAVANNGWIIIYSHMAADDYDENKIRAILNYAKEKMDFVSVQEGLNRFGNIAQFGDLRQYGGSAIQADGTTEGDLGNYITSKMRDFDPNEPITSFKKSAMTTIRVLNPEAESYDLPANLGGIIHTFRSDNDDRFSYQKHISWRYGEERIRHWNHETNEWKPWSDVSPYTLFNVEVSSKNYEPFESRLVTFSANIGKNDALIANPDGVMPIGFLWNVHHRDGGFHIRITNANDESKYTSAMNWTIAHIPYE